MQSSGGHWQKRSERRKINKELLAFAFYLPRGEIFSKLILILRNHFSDDNPQTTSPSDFSTERNTNHFPNLLYTDQLFSWIKMCIMALLYSKLRWSCALSWMFVSLWRCSFLVHRLLWPCVAALHIYFFYQSSPQPATLVIWFHLLQLDLIYSHMFYSCVVFYLLGTEPAKAIDLLGCGVFCVFSYRFYQKKYGFFSIIWISSCH